MSTQRTRSLTREEAKMRDDERSGHFGYDDRSASAQRLDRPSRADSRVTFALDTVKKEQSPPIPPARSRDHAKQEASLENYTNRSADARDKVRRV